MGAGDPEIEAEAGVSMINLAAKQGLKPEE